MAFNITDLDGTTGAPDGTWPYGRIIDGQTRVNSKLNLDIMNFFMKLCDEAGITPDGTYDNTLNGFQLYEAFEAQTGGGAWVDLGTSLTITCDPGTITVQTADIIYNRYQLVGKTFRYKLQIQNVTVASSPTTIIISLPTAITSLGLTFANDLGVEVNSFDQQGKACYTTLNVNGGFGTNKILMSRVDGTAFTNGTNNQWYHLNIECELE